MFGRKNSASRPQPGNEREAQDATHSDLVGRYLGVLKSSLLNEIYLESEARLLYIFYQHAHGLEVSREVVRDIRVWRADIVEYVSRARRVGNIAYVFSEKREGLEKSYNFRDVCEFSHTMIGRLRMESLHRCMDAVRTENIPGDFIETGVWRGGACVFMRGYLAAHAMEDRKVWLADSFQGLPKPTHPADEGWDFSKEVEPSFAVSLDEVKEVFRRYDLLDDRVAFLEGWFKDTLPTAPIERLAILRLDGDLFESTMDALSSLYDRVSPGGFIVVDDYCLEPCKRAITEFRASRSIVGVLEPIDEQSVYWRKGVR